jgi:hypothetical protein
MAYKIYNHVELSDVKTMTINKDDGSGFLYFKGDEVPTAYNNLRTLPVTGFVHFKNGNLCVSRKVKQEMAGEVIIKYWRFHKLKTARIRNDLVLRGLAEYHNHPRRLFPEFFDEFGSVKKIELCL